MFVEERRQIWHIRTFTGLEGTKKPSKSIIQTLTLLQRQPQRLGDQVLFHAPLTLQSCFLLEEASILWQLTKATVIELRNFLDKEKRTMVRAAGRRRYLRNDLRIKTC